jgi:hypothetical protein
MSIIVFAPDVLLSLFPVLALQNFRRAYRGQKVVHV